MWKLSGIIVQIHFTNVTVIYQKRGPNGSVVRINVSLYIYRVFIVKHCYNFNLMICTGMKALCVIFRALYRARCENNLIICSLHYVMKVCMGKSLSFVMSGMVNGIE